MIKVIKIFAKERFPYIIFALISFGITLTAAFITRSFSPLRMGMVFFSLFLFFLLLRLMDDAKDIGKDKIAYPERPLSRGFLQLDNVEKTIGILEVFLISLAAAFWLLSAVTAAFLLLLMAVYSWHSYKNFYLGNSIENWPYFNSITSQIIYLIPPFFAAAALKENFLFTPPIFQFALLTFSSFAASDVCRKLNPKAHPVLLTFVHYVGFRKSFLYASFFLLLGAISAFALKIGFLLWPIQLAVLFMLIAVFLNSSRYELAEKTGLALLLAAVYAIPFSKIGFLTSSGNL